MAEHHGSENVELHAAIKAFDNVYATNDVDTYCGFYSDDATVYIYGARQGVFMLFLIRVQFWRFECP
jgi:ketosteroid isomerase-like protein